MLLRDYRPRAMLTTSQTKIERPRFPVIDAHNHLGSGFGEWDQRPVAELLDALDRAGVHKYINLDGGWGEDIIADPVAFFEPLDETNERWEELQAHPDWQFPSPPFPPFQALVDGLANIVARHPGTDFIGAHVGCYSENLQWVGALMQRCPNFYVDISARISELGRQPYSSRRFFIDHADQIMFGTDSGPRLDTYQTYYRFLETDDEYFNYAGERQPGQGRWAIYGVYLPDDVLHKVYFGNAERVIFKRG